MGGKVLIPQDVSGEGKRYLIARGYELKMGSGTAVDVLIHEVQDCDAVLIRTALFPEEVIKSAPKLKVISRHGVGFDNIAVTEAANRGIYVTYTPAANAITVAEHTLTLILALAKNLKRFEEKFRDGHFEVRNQVQGIDLAGKTLGLIGAGRIGTLVGKKARFGFDMNVIAFDPYVPHHQRVPDFQWTDSIAELLKQVDVLSLHLPYTAQNRHMISTKEFSMMKPSAYIINTSRGGLVDEVALVEALKNKGIAGAGLDVFESEPPPKGHQLFQMENVILTPHCAAHTKECMDRMALHAAMGIDEVLSGKEPTWRVNNPVKSTAGK